MNLLSKKTAFYRLLLIALLISCNDILATDYIIDSQSDFNNFSGNTFSPGDRILFQRGQIFNGQFVVNGSGSSSNPIIVNWRGSSGAKPILNGNGVVGGTLQLNNVEYIEISNLEITNSASTNANRQGIYILGEDAGVLEHIYVSDCYIHDVKGDLTSRQIAKKTGGINFEVIGSGTLTRFNDVRIENNDIRFIDGVGIRSNTSWKTGIPFAPGEGHTNVLLDGNYIEECAKDGVLINGCDAPLIQYNTVNNGASKLNGAGLWPFACKDAVFQYNEAYNTELIEFDGAGFDADYNCEGSIFQYNYSHDNEGGAFNIMRRYNKDLIIRYNICQNNGRTLIYYGFKNANELTNAKIYNNTFYTSASTSLSSGLFQAINTSFENNIFYFENGVSWGPDDGGLSWSHNSYFGIPAKSGDTNAVTTNPVLANPGSGGTQIDMKSPDKLPGYKLVTGSPAINAGKTISGNGDEDFYGIPISGPQNIGAYEGNGVAGNAGGNILNPGFETGDFSSWTTTGTRSVVANNEKSGTYAAYVGTASASGRIEQVVTDLTPNTDYQLKVWIRCANGRMFVNVKDFGATAVQASTTSTSYVELTLEFTTGPSNTSATISGWSANNTANSHGYFDDFRMLSSAPTPSIFPNPNKWYRLVHRETGRNLYGRGTGSVPQFNVEMGTGTNDFYQWRFEAVEGSGANTYYRVVHRGTGRNLHGRGSGGNPPFNAELGTGFSDFYKWKIDDVDGTYKRLVHKPSDRNLWGRGGGATPANNVETDLGTGNWRQWQFIELGDTSVSLRSEIPIIEPEASSGLNIYPNPAGSLITIDYSGLFEGEVHLRIMDMSGQFFDEIHSSGGSSTLDMSNYSNGVYLVRISQGQRSLVRKIIKD